MSTSENKPAASLYAKLAAVQGEITRVPKSGVNTGLGYKYATNEDVLDLIRPLLAAHGIAFFALMAECAQTAEQTRSGKPTTRTRVAIDYTLADAETGETITTRWHGEALDDQDKGINKAATQAKKYFLLNTFLISTGDLQEDPDAGAGAAVNESPDAAWGSYTSLAEMYDQFRAKIAEATPGEIAQLVDITNPWSLDRKAGWGKYASRHEAGTAVKEAWELSSASKFAAKNGAKAAQTEANGKEAAAPTAVEKSESKEKNAADGKPF